MKLVLFELKKMCGSRLLLFAFVLLCVCNIANVYQQYRECGRPDDLFGQQYARYYDELRGPMTSEHIAFVVEQYQSYQKQVESGNYSTEYDPEHTLIGSVYSDMNLFREFYEQMEYAYHYSSNLDEILDRAHAEETFFREKENWYEMRKNEQIQARYQGRSIHSFYDTSGIQQLFHYDFSSLLILLLLILGAAGVFSSERETEMADILHTTIRGGRPLVKAKLAATTLFTTLVSACFFLTDVLAFSYFFGLDGFQNPLYSMAQLQFTPLNLSIGSYLLMFYGTKLLSLLVISRMILLLSSLTTEQLMSLIFSGAAVIFLIVSHLFDFGWIGNRIGVCNPINLLTPILSVETYQVENVFGYPVLRIYLLIAMQLGLLLLLRAGLMWVNRTGRRGRLRIGRKERKQNNDSTI